MKWPWSGSIAQRIKWAFYVLMALVVLGLIISWINLQQISTQIDALKTTSGFLDKVLDIRRYEKNWIIYRDIPDFNTNQGISPELSVGLFTIKDTFTFYARYRYNLKLHTEGTNFHEITIGLYSGFFSLYLD